MHLLIRGAFHSYLPTIVIDIESRCANARAFIRRYRASQAEMHGTLHATAVYAIAFPQMV